MKVKVFISLALLSIFLLGASNFERFNECIQKKDLKGAKIIINNWGQNKENDPQYYICLFNYHMNMARTEGIGLQKKPPKDVDTLIFTDRKTGEIVGYTGPIVQYEKKEAQKAIEYLKVGINKFPDHYEMRFGLLWTYKELHQTDNYLSELENAFIYLTKVNPAKIFWNNNASITNPRHFVVEKTQQCFHDIEIDDEELFDDIGFMHKYCDLMIKYFPRHKYGYSNKGIIYCKSNDLKNGLTYHFKAFSLDNQDALIAANIGFTYKLMGDKMNAIKYFNKVLEISKEEYYVEGAKRQLEELRKK